MNKEEVLSQYDLHKPVYERICAVTVPLLHHLLEAAGVKSHSIIPRVKERGSLSEKLSREGKSYAALEDVKDIVGIRIITYFEDELDAIDVIIKKEFKVDPNHSYDRRSQLQANQFGYRSVHYVCEYSNERTGLPEYRAFDGQVIEIQTRSLLQHAWAEIEHDYYKSKGPKPEAVERRNSRLAGMLEIVDAEFVSIRKELEKYRKNIDLRIDTGEDLENLKLDAVSLASFIDKDSTIADIEADYQLSGMPIRESIEQETISMSLRGLLVIDITRLQQLRQLFIQHRKNILPFLAEWRSWIINAGSTMSPSYPKGISVYHLSVLEGALQGKVKLQQLFDRVREDKTPPPFMDDLVDYLPELAHSIVSRADN